MENRKLTDSEKAEIAELAADIAYKRFYASVGESVIKKLAWGLSAAGVVIWYVVQNGTMPK